MLGDFSEAFFEGVEVVAVVVGEMESKSERSVHVRCTPPLVRVEDDEPICLVP